MIAGHSLTCSLNYNFFSQGSAHLAIEQLDSNNTQLARNQVALYNNAHFASVTTETVENIKKITITLIRYGESVVTCIDNISLVHL